MESDDEEIARVGEYKSGKGNESGKYEGKKGDGFDVCNDEDKGEEDNEGRDDEVVELPCIPCLLPDPRPDSPARKSDTLRLNAPDVSISDYFVQEQQTLRYQKEHRVRKH